MKFIEEYDKTDIQPCAATIGCFDGVHTGHRYLVKQVRDIAYEKGLKDALITFPVHPRQVMQAAASGNAGRLYAGTVIVSCSKDFTHKFS